MARDTFSTNSEDSMATRVLDMLRRRWMLAFAVFAGVLATAVAFALYLPDLYRSTALVLVERPVSEAVSRVPVAGELESRLYVIKQEILSRDRLTALIERFNLYPELRARASFEDVLNQARQDVNVDPSGPEQVNGRVKTVSFTLSFTGDSREKVAEVTNAVAAFYVQQNDLMRTNEATTTTKVLQGQLADAKRDLERQERALRDFTTQAAGELPQQAAVTMARLTSLNTQLANNGADQRRLQDAKEKIFESTPVTVAVTRAEAGASPQSIERLNQIELAKARLAQLRTNFGVQHPDVVSAQTQLATLEELHTAAEAEEARQRRAAAAVAAAADGAPAPAPVQGRRTLADIDAELAVLKEEAAQLKVGIDDLTNRLESTPGRQQEFTLVNRDYQTAKEHYDSLARTYDQALLTSNVETGGFGERFRVLEAAIPPEGPSAPNRNRLLLVGLLLALGAAVGAVLLREQFDPSFHSVDDIREFTAVPVLVSIPPMGPAPAGRYLRTALATVSTVALIALVATMAAYVARGNDQLVRLIAF